MNPIGFSILPGPMVQSRVGVEVQSPGLSLLADPVTCIGPGILLSDIVLVDFVGGAGGGAGGGGGSPRPGSGMIYPRDLC